MNKNMITCPTCGITFCKRRVGHTYCSRNCRPAYIKLKQSRSKFAINGISTGTVGAISELVASVDLMSKGYEVYRALSPASSCDILTLKDGQPITFEVRTGRRNYKGTMFYPKERIRATNLAIVIHETKEVIYIPSIV